MLARLGEDSSEKPTEEMPRSGTVARTVFSLSVLCVTSTRRRGWSVIAVGSPVSGVRASLEQSCLTAVVVVTGGLAVGHGVFERDPGDPERLQECRCRVAEHLVGVSAAC